MILGKYFQKNLLNWRILSQPAKIGSGKNKKSLFFLLGLKITLRTCFESNTGLNLKGLDEKTVVDQMVFSHFNKSQDRRIVEWLVEIIVDGQISLY